MIFVEIYKMITLPKVVWANIRSFSGDTGYQPTATAQLMKDLTFVCGSPHFLSTLVMAKDLVVYHDLFGNYIPDVSRKLCWPLARERRQQSLHRPMKDFRRDI